MNGPRCLGVCLIVVAVVGRNNLDTRRNLRLYVLAAAAAAAAVILGQQQVGKIGRVNDFHSPTRLL
jgi:hypothetical protein